MSKREYELPDNLESHRHSWQSALVRLVELEVDDDNRSYWEHELKAMRDMYDDLDRIVRSEVSQ